MPGRRLRKRKLEDEVTEDPKKVRPRRRIEKVEDNERQVRPKRVITLSDIVLPRKMKLRASNRHRHVSPGAKLAHEQVGKQEVKEECKQEAKYSRAWFELSAGVENAANHDSEVEMDGESDDSNYSDEDEDQPAAAVNDAIGNYGSGAETNDDSDEEESQFASAGNDVIKVARELTSAAANNTWKRRIGEVLPKHFPAPTPPSNKKDDGDKDDASAIDDHWQPLKETWLKAQAAEAWQRYCSDMSHVKYQTADAAVDLKGVGDKYHDQEQELDADIEQIKERARADAEALVDMMGAVLQKRVGQMEEDIKMALQLQVQRLQMEFGVDGLGGSLGDSSLGEGCLSKSVLIEAGEIQGPVDVRIPCLHRDCIGP